MIPRRAAQAAAGRRLPPARAAAGALAILLGLLPAVGGCGPHAAGRTAAPAPAGHQAHAHDSAAVPAPKPAKAAKPATRPSPRAGAYPAPAVPEAVVIGNDPGARPQSGLSRADVVWEILAEGGITRFFAIFASQGAPRIGPVRSARIYFDQLDRAYGIPFAHAGGNVDALNWIGTWHLASIDQIYGAGPYFWRGTRRRPPDNLYTSTARLVKATVALRLHSGGMTYPAAGPPPAAGSPTGSVTLRYWHAADYTYTVVWRWRDGWWRRYVNGAPVATLAGRRLHTGTVIVLAVAQAPDPDPHTPGAIKLLWNRGGTAWILRGGRRFDGVWRLGRNGLPTVLSRNGTPLPVGGRRPYWYEVVPSPNAVSFGR